MDATIICDSCALASQAIGKSPVGMGIATLLLLAVLLVYAIPLTISWLSKMEPSRNDPFQDDEKGAL